MRSDYNKYVYIISFIEVVTCFLQKFVTLSLWFHDLGLFHPQMQQIKSLNLHSNWVSPYRWLLFQCLVLALCLYNSTAYGAPGITKINDVRIADRQENTRVVFDLSSATNHHVFVLKNPDRVVLEY